MSSFSSSFLFFFLSLFFFPCLSQSLRGVLIDCGASVDSVFNEQKWVSDTGFISAGTPKNLTVQVLDSTLSTVRTFPLQNNVFKKFCYQVPVYRGGKYLVRTTYFYGGVNGNLNPPVFDQIVDGTFWSPVNTTEDYWHGMSSYYEGFFMAVGKTMSVCLAANSLTDSDPFISALELVLVSDSLYNSTDFTTYALSLIARSSFGNNGSIIRYPDDEFDRYWEPYGQHSPAASVSRVSVSGIWNHPPAKVFQTRFTISQLEPMELLWPPAPLPNATYYIALYFAEDQDSFSGRAFNISINDILFYPNLSVAPAGMVVFANQWLLNGNTKITLTPLVGSSIGPLINAGEVFEVLPVGGKTHTRDVIALERLKESFKNPPPDWNGDPCLPPQYPWTGVTCAGGPRIRVITLNLTSMGLLGSISPSISRLTALSGLWLGNNSLTGSIPDLSSLSNLEILHLEDNQLSGEIPPSLGNVKSLNEIFLHNNNLTGNVPSSLLGNPKLNLRTTPGNPLLSQPPK
ncbi:putative LRR receptor-like serine/threonine-protein kinase At1g67720 [Nicotiana tabacum]|uniref:LRR receptor-like serine/threonine-protein kinase At1g67720 n=1 Tax=Nicotiana tabacum TaxID=4097 RepID=A0A1S4BCY0_TOBAC|nr:PREDICTED: probable LRR receptor-like serine/threonine-protein kinase At1g67720 [Nicotiana tabacum]